MIWLSYLQTMTYNHFASWRDNPEPLTPFLSVVIPAYNEAERIVPTIASIIGHLVDKPYTFELIVSDDGSTDATVEMCRNLQLRNVRVIGDGINRGKGAAVRKGVQAAAGQWILFTDADLSTPIEELDRLFEAGADADVIIGSRAAGDATEQSKSAVRHALSFVSRKVVAGLLGLDIADSQCGFKLFTRSAAATLFGLQRIDGFGFDAELLFLAKRNELKVAEVPVRWIDAPGSTVDPLRAPVEFVRDLIRVRALAAAGRYRHNNKAARGIRVAVVTALPPSDASLTEYGQHLVDNLRKVDDIAELMVFAEDSNGVPESEDDLTVIPAWTFNSLTSPFRLTLAALRHRPDVALFNIHFTSFATKKVAAALSLAVPLVMRLLGVPTIVLTHNLVDTTDLEAAGYSSSPIQQRVLTAIGRGLTRVLLGANHVVTTMPRYVEILRENYGAENVSLTPHGSFECPPFSPSTDFTNRRLLAFGKFGTYKRVEHLVEAYRELRLDPAYADVELVIAGTDSPTTPGYLASVEESLNGLDGVRFTGYVAEEDVASLFTDAHIVVFPYSGTTGSSGPLHQAGSYSRPVIAPRIGDLLDLIDEEGYAAQPYEAGDVASLTNAITTLLDDPNRMRSMGEQNHAAAIGLSLADVAEWHTEHLLNAAR